jgi:hypothetical protein
VAVPPIGFKPTTTIITNHWLACDCLVRTAVAIEPSLRSLSAENGSFRGSGRRLLPEWHASLPIWKFRDRRRIAKARQQPAFLPFEGWQARPWDSLAGAGGFEPPHGGIKIPCLTTWRRPKAVWKAAGRALPRIPSGTAGL